MGGASCLKDYNGRSGSRGKTKAFFLDRNGPKRNVKKLFLTRQLTEKSARGLLGHLFTDLTSQKVLIMCSDGLIDVKAIAEITIIV